MPGTVEEIGLERGLIPSYDEGSTHNPYLMGEALKLPFNIMPITGAFLGEAAYEDYAQVLQDTYKQNVKIVELDSTRSDKVLDDYAEELISEMGDMDNIVLNPHSRPYDVVTRALHILETRKQLWRIRLVVPMNTGGSHFELPEDPQLAAQPRHTKEFRTIPDPNDENLEVLEPEVARDIFGRFIADQQLVDRIVNTLHSQPKLRAGKAEWLGFPRSVPVAVLQGAQDPALNLPRASAVLQKTHGRFPRLIPEAGHMLPAEMPEVVASLLIKHSVVAQIR